FRPGITGLWQVSGRSEITDFDEVVKLDVAYMDDWTIWRDIRILLKTIKVVVKKDGAK
ncbi:MAG: sugar transferase, partial [Streptococcus vestibularis]|nr:sugar transferase [Streptococcus vestibularis]